MGDLRKKFERKYIRVTMPDGSEWDVPVMIVAMDRSMYYARKRGECGGDVERHLDHDTLPVFEDESEILDWARNNMNWKDVAAHAQKVGPAPRPDFEEGWANGDAEIIEKGKKELICPECGYTYAYEPGEEKLPGACPNCKTELVDVIA